jgi:hypothetical protein
VSSLREGFVCLLAYYIFSMCCLFSLVDSRLDLCFNDISSRNDNCFSFLWKHWTSSHRYFEPSRSHNWITSMVVFYSGNPKCSKCFDRKNFPQEHQPHVDPSPTSPIRSSFLSSLARSSSISFSLSSERSQTSNLVDKKKKKRKIRRRRNERIRRRKINKGQNL